MHSLGGGRKEVERIVGGPLADATDAVKLNHVYIWAGAHAEQLVEARQSEDPEPIIDAVSKFLLFLEECLTHTTQFREKTSTMPSRHQARTQPPFKVASLSFTDKHKFLPTPTFSSLLNSSLGVPT